MTTISPFHSHTSHIPDSHTPSTKQHNFPSPIIGLLIVAAVLILQRIFTFILLQIFADTMTTTQPYTGLITLISYAAYIPLLCIPLFMKTSLRNLFSIRPFHPKLILPLILFAPALIIFVNNLELLMAVFIKREPYFLHTLTTIFSGTSIQQLIMFMTATIFIAPLCEELLFRGLLIGNWKKRMSPMLAIILVSVLFTALHAWPQASALVSILLISFVFGYLTVKTNSILPSLFLHILTNAAAIISGLLAYHYHLIDTYFSTDITLHDISWSSLILSGLFTIGLFLYLARVIDENRYNTDYTTSTMNH